MVIAATLASEAIGWQITGAVAIRSLAVDRGGRPEARGWVAPPAGPKLPVELVRAGQRGRQRRGRVRRRRSAQHRPYRDDRLGGRERTGAPDLAAPVLDYDVAGRVGATITPA